MMYECANLYDTSPGMNDKIIREFPLEKLQIT